MPPVVAPAVSHAPAGARPDPAGVPSVQGLADRCVQCGLCLPHCPTYRLDGAEGESPRGRIALARALADGRLAPSPAAEAHLDHCLGCGRCEAVCPAGVEFGVLLDLARAAQTVRRPLSRGQHWRLGLLARPGWLRTLLALYRGAWPLLPIASRLLPRPPSSTVPPRPAPGPDPAPAPPVQARYAVFSGCVAATYEAPTRAALGRLFAAVGLHLDAPRDQGCCGAAARHAGDPAGAEALAARNRAAFGGGPPVLCLASGCQAELRAGLAGTAPVADVFEALEENGAELRFRDAGGARVALHLPCTQRATPAAVAALRRLLARVPNLSVVELPDTGCCGAAGLHMHAFPARAAAVRAPLLTAFAASGASMLLSANIGCRLHLGNALGAAVVHPVDFLDGLLE
jgi:glycolate oxidase iron-sulfur subunit